MIERIEAGLSVAAYAASMIGDGAARRERKMRRPAPAGATAEIAPDAVEMAEIRDAFASLEIAELPEEEPGIAVAATDIAHRLAASAADGLAMQARLGPDTVRRLVTVNLMNRV